MITSFPLGKHHESLATAEGRLHLSILLYSSQDGKEATIFLQQTGSLGEQQDPRCVFPPYSGQPDPGQCAASCHHCDWGRGCWSTDPGPCRWSTALAPGHFWTDLCNGSAPRRVARIFPCECYFTPHAGMLHNTGTDGAWGHTTQAGVYAHLQHSLAFCGTYYSPPTEWGFNPIPPCKSRVQEQLVLMFCFHV